ncbi:MAG: hypothetical protein ACTSU2_03515 [Promethearchaeota archaeon]
MAKKEKIPAEKSNQLDEFVEQVIKLKDLDEQQVTELCKEIFGEIKNYNILLKGLSKAFSSEHPFENAGKYLQNVEKIYGRIRSIFCQSCAKFFKNMVMETGHAKIIIHSLAEYRDVQKKIFKYFNMYPPKAENVINQILEDNAAITKLETRLDLYFRLEELFSPYKEQLAQIRKKVINSIERDLKNIENQLKSVNNEIRLLQSNENARAQGGVPKHIEELEYKKNSLLNMRARMLEVLLFLKSIKD